MNLAASVRSIASELATATSANVIATVASRRAVKTSCEPSRPARRSARRRAIHARATVMRRPGAPWMEPEDGSVPGKSLLMLDPSAAGNS